MRVVHQNAAYCEYYRLLFFQSFNEILTLPIFFSEAFISCHLMKDDMDFVCYLFLFLHLSSRILVFIVLIYLFI